MTEAKKPAIPWDVIEKEYRAGIRPLRDIAADAGVTEGAIRKRAKRDEWTRNLQAKIQAKAEEKVRKDAVRTPGTQLTVADEKQVVEANAEIVANADLLNRKHVVMGIDTSVAQLEELATLAMPGLQEALEHIADVMFSPDKSGRDQVNELYRYIISLAGRVKMAKDIAGALGTYIPMQRKILKLDADADKNEAVVDEILRRINATGD